MLFFYFYFYFSYRRLIQQLVAEHLISNRQVYAYVYVI